MSGILLNIRSAKYGKYVDVILPFKTDNILLIPFSKFTTEISTLNKAVDYLESVGYSCVVSYETENIICAKREKP